MTTRSTPVPLIALTGVEISMLTEAMRDLQLSVAEYYAESAGPGDLGRRVRKLPDRYADDK